VQHEPVARIFLDEFARCEMVLEIDDHRGVSRADLAAVLAQVLVSVIANCPVSPSLKASLRSLDGAERNPG
jgi:hypothetical protein